jgi:phage-related tail fiber protein
VAIGFYSNLDLNGNQINELGDGVLSTDGINLGQLTSALNTRDYKQSVRVSSATNVSVAAPGATVDGVALSVGDRFFLRGQTLGQENGLYEYQGAATPATRTTDADTSAEVTAGMVVIVEEGTAADTLWVLSTNNPIVLGTTPLVFTRIGGAAFTALVGDGSSQTIAVTHNLGTKALHVTVYRNSGSFEEVVPEIRHTDNNTVTFRFTPAPAVNEFAVVIS